MPTIIKNGRNYSGTSVSLTQAEYDALPEVTKMNGTTYFITDSEVVLNAEDVALDEGNLNDLAGSVATIETSPATANHEVGEYILWNGVVYVVTSAIATGENLVINSNISARTIGSELTALNNGLMNSGTTTDGGWNKLPDGTLVQWGTCKVPSGSFTAAIAFHQPFINERYSIQITPIQSGTSWNINYSTSTASSFSIGRTPNTSANDYYWFAIGRWK